MRACKGKGKGNFKGKRKNKGKQLLQTAVLLDSSDPSIDYGRVCAVRWSSRVPGSGAHLTFSFFLYDKRSLFPAECPSSTRVAFSIQSVLPREE